MRRYIVLVGITVGSAALSLTGSSTHYTSQVAGCPPKLPTIQTPAVPSRHVVLPDGLFYDTPELPSQRVTAPTCS